MQEPAPDIAPWQKLPADMAVSGVPKMFATTLSPDGTVWLWLRTPHACLAFDFDPDASETLGKSFLELAKKAREMRDPELAVVKAPLLGPDGRPV